MFATAAAISRPGSAPAVGPRLSIVREAAGVYDTAGPASQGPDSDADADDGLAVLAAAVDAVVGAGPVDGWSIPACERRAAAVNRQVRRLRAHLGDLMAAVTDREASEAAATQPDDPRAAERAERTSKARQRRQLGMSDQEVGDAVEGARGLADTPDADRARRDGRLGPAQARIAADILGRLTGDARDQVEAELVANAHLDPRAFGRLARRLLADADHDAAMRRLDQQYDRRRGSVTSTPDGTTRLFLETTGLDGEVVAAAIDAYRTRDGHDTPRNPSQRTADAIVAALRAALEHGAPATARGSRPHVQVVIDYDRIRAGTGTGFVPWTGSLPTGELRRLLGDSLLARLVCDGDSLPLDTGRATRGVSVGIWRAVAARDRGCTWPGCDAPPAWCDAAHIDRRWTDGAGVSVGEVALACRYHHRHIDRHDLTGRLVDGHVVWGSATTPPTRAGATAAPGNPSDPQARPSRPDRPTTPRRTTARPPTPPPPDQPPPWTGRRPARSVPEPPPSDSGPSPHPPRPCDGHAPRDRTSPGRTGDPPGPMSSRQVRGRQNATSSQAVVNPCEP